MCDPKSTYSRVVVIFSVERLKEQVVIEYHGSSCVEEEFALKKRMESTAKH